MSKFTHITEWAPNEEDRFIINDVNNKTFILNPKKCFKRSYNKNPEALTALCTFHNKRKLFHKYGDDVVLYIDYFINNYDTDKELIPIYIKLKTDIDNGKLNNPEIFRKQLLSKLFKDSRIKNGCVSMVFDNYHLDISTVGGREYLKRTDFTNEEAKMFLATSTMMKLAIPIVAHYISTNKSSTIEERHEIISSTFIDIFHRMCTPDEYVDILNKLYIFITGKVDSHSKEHSKMWQKQAAIGNYTEDSFIDELLSSDIIYKNLFKLNFKDNLMAFFKIIIEKSLKNKVAEVKHTKDILLIESYNINLISNTDKMEQTLAKFDEAKLDICELSIGYVKNDYSSKYGEISQEELKYYLEHTMHGQFQTKLTSLNYARAFNGFMELNNMSGQTYIEFMILYKHKCKEIKFNELYNLISSNVMGKRRTNPLKTAKFIVDIMNSPTYKDLINKSYVTLKNYKEEDILNTIEFVLAHKFSYVDYTQPALLGKEIQFNNYILVDELLTAIDSI